MTDQAIDRISDNLVNQALPVITWIRLNSRQIHNIPPPYSIRHKLVLITYLRYVFFGSFCRPLIFASEDSDVTNAASAVGAALFFVSFVLLASWTLLQVRPAE